MKKLALLFPVMLLACGEIEDQVENPFHGEEDTPMLCSDSFDNDGDGFLDCYDSGCSGVYLCVAVENTDVLCDDGIDNDGDGYIDCEDRQRGSDDESFCIGDPSARICGPTLPEDNDAACSDGVDNNRNGYTDCQDWDCSRDPDVTVCGESSPEDTDAACSDNEDNDRDGFIDCNDYDCQTEDITVCD